MKKDKLIHLFSLCGGMSLLRLSNPMPRVVFWHGVDRIKDPAIESESICIDVFEKQIEYLSKHYDVISMDEFYQRYINRSFKGKEIVITFDDGYLNNLTCAAPILQKHSLPFLIFVSTENIERQTLFATSLARLIVIGAELGSVNLDSIGFHVECTTREQRVLAARGIGRYLKEQPQSKVKDIVEDLQSLIPPGKLQCLIEQYPSIKPMTWNDILCIKKLGGTIGSHCLDHFCCQKNQLEEDLRDQIVRSKKVIEDKVKDDCLYFAYPNGDYTLRSNQYVHEAGYRMGFAVGAGKLLRPGEDLASLPRFGMLGDYEKSLVSLNIGLKTRRIIGL